MSADMDTERPERLNFYYDGGTTNGMPAEQTPPSKRVEWVAKLPTGEKGGVSVYTTYQLFPKWKRLNYWENPKDYPLYLKSGFKG